MLPSTEARTVLSFAPVDRLAGDGKPIVEVAADETEAESAGRSTAVECGSAPYLFSKDSIVDFIASGALDQRVTSRTSRCDGISLDRYTCCVAFRKSDAFAL